MADWGLPFYGGLLWSGEAGDAAFADGNSNGTKGAWNELITAVALPVVGLSVMLKANYQSQYALFDIGVGSAGNEVAMHTNLPSKGPIIEQPWKVFLPGAIPAGVRVSARVSAHNAGWSAHTIRVRPLLASFGSAPAMAGTIDIGTDTANSRGTTCVANNTWIQLSSSLPVAIKGFYLVLTSGDNNATQVINAYVGVGGAGSEVAIWEESELIAQSFADNNSNLMHAGYQTGYINAPVAIPAGTRVSVKLIDVYNGSAENIYVSLIGWY